MNDLQMFRLASVFARLTPITVAAMIADIADTPIEQSHPADAQVMKYALDTPIGLVGAAEAIEMLATYEIDATHPIVADAVEEWTQPDMFPAGEDTPLFTLPEDPAEPEWVTAFNQSSAEPSAPAETCSKCNRHPFESGLANWTTCDTCGEPVCDTCAYHEYEGYFCGQKCLNEAIGAEEIE